MRKTRPDRVYDLRRAHTLDLDHHPIALAPTELDGPHLVPGVIPNRYAMTEGVKASGFDDLIDCFPSQKLDQYVRRRGPGRGRVGVESRHGCPLCSGFSLSRFPFSLGVTPC